MPRTKISSISPVAFDSFLYNGTNQFATIADNAAYSIPTTGAITVSVWVKQYTNQFTNQEGSGYVNFLGKSHFDTVNEVEWQMRIYSLSNNETDLRGNESSFYIFNSTGGIGISSDVRRQIHDVGRWVHYLGTASGGTVKLYKDNKCEEVADYSAVTPENTATALYVAHADNNGYFYGEIGPIKLWNRVLSDYEIQEQYVRNANNTNGLVGHWIADQANNRLSDQTAAANHGTLSGSPTFVSNAYSAVRRPTLQRKLLSSGQSLSLNGSSQYASIAHASQSGLDLGSGDFLFTGWVKFNTTSGHQVLFAKCDTGHAEPSAAGAVGYELIYTRSGSNNDLRLFLRTAGAYINLGTPVFQDNEAHAVAVVCKRNSGGRVQLWVDGVYITGTSVLTGSLDNDGAYFMGVTSGSGRTNYVNGKMWGWRLHTWSAGTMPNTYQQIIDDVWRSRGSSVTNGLVSKWDFNGAATDSVGSNSLTLTGSPSYSTLTGRTVVS